MTTLPCMLEESRSFMLTLSICVGSISQRALTVHIGAEGPNVDNKGPQLLETLSKPSE